MIKYYWLSAICFKPRSGPEPQIFEHVTTEHPFTWLHHYNYGDPEDLHDACRDKYTLVSWREITKEESDLWFHLEDQ